MPDIVKINGVTEDGIAKIDGVETANIVKVSGATYPVHGDGATKWIVGATNGKVYKTSASDASDGWSEIVDLGAGNGKGIAIGEDNSGNKRWVLHRSTTAEEIAYVNDGDEDTLANWTEINMSNNHVAVDGGPSVAWGNNYWIGSGDDVAINPAPSDEDVLFASSDGGATWSTVEISAQQTNDTGRTACYKDNTTFFFTVMDQIWRTTADPTNASNWSSVQDFAGGQDILCMAYNGTDLWVCAGQSGEVHTSDDDWDTATSRTGGHGTSNINGVVFCSGTVNKWVTVGASGKIAYSDNGIDWTSATTGIASALRAVATDNTTIVAVGDSGMVLTSTDAVNWSQVVHDPVINYRFWSIACDIIGAGMR